MNQIYEYLLHFLLGGTLFIILFHFTKEKNTIISSIIPAFPVVFLTGFFYLIYFHGNVKKYTRNAIFTFVLLTFFIFILHLLLSVFSKNLYLSILLSFSLYILILYLLISYGLLK